MTTTPRNLIFRSNQFFFQPFGMKNWAGLYDLTQGEYRMHVRTSADSPVVVYTFDSLGSAGQGQGSLDYDPVSQVLVASASYTDVKTFLSTPGTYVYDLQYTIRDVTGAAIFVRDLAFGTLTVSNGVTRS